MNERKEGTQAESVIYLPPRGIRGGLVSGLPLTGGREGVYGSFFFLFIYIYFSLYIKKKIKRIIINDGGKVEKAVYRADVQ